MNFRPPLVCLLGSEREGGRCHSLDGGRLQAKRIVPYSQVGEGFAAGPHDGLAGVP